MLARCSVSVLVIFYTHRRGHEIVQPPPFRGTFGKWQDTQPFFRLEGSFTCRTTTLCRRDFIDCSLFGIVDIRPNAAVRFAAASFASPAELTLIPCGLTKHTMCTLVVVIGTWHGIDDGMNRYKTSLR
eukprot:scaffold1048_cov90-Amphora_coffeaeformis.AAC.31